MTIPLVQRHRVMAELPYPIGAADDRDDIPVKVDITYNKHLTEDGPQYEVLDVTPLMERFGGDPYDRETLTDLAHDYLYGAFDDAIMAKGE